MMIIVVKFKWDYIFIEFFPRLARIIETVV